MKTFSGTPEERNAHSQGWSDCYEHWKHKIEQKELSDEEIKEIFGESSLKSGSYVDFARAIIKEITE